MLVSVRDVEFYYDRSRWRIIVEASYRLVRVVKGVMEGIDYRVFDVLYIYMVLYRSVLISEDGIYSLESGMSKIAYAGEGCINI